MKITHKNENFSNEAGVTNFDCFLILQTFTLTRYIEICFLGVCSNTKENKLDQRN